MPLSTFTFIHSSTFYSGCDRKSTCGDTESWAGFPGHRPGASQVWRNIPTVTGLDTDATDVWRSPSGSSPGPSSSSICQSLSRKGTAEARTAQEVRVPVREAAATFCYLLSFISECWNVRLRGTIQEIPWYCTNSNTRDSKP